MLSRVGWKTIKAHTCFEKMTSQLISAVCFLGVTFIKLSIIWRSSLCAEKNKIQDGLKWIRSSNWLLVLWQDLLCWCYVDLSAAEKPSKWAQTVFSYCLKICTAFKPLGNMQTCHCSKMRFSFRRTVFCRSWKEYYKYHFPSAPLCVCGAGRSC